jgi:hypothetical protein
MTSSISKENNSLMGKIVNSTFVSLDGVINHMDRWHFDFIDAESDAIALRQLQDSQAMLEELNTRLTLLDVQRLGSGVVQLRTQLKKEKVSWTITGS